jgi:hypothetical protein
MTYFSIELLSQASAYYSFRKKRVEKKRGSDGGERGREKGSEPVESIYTYIHKALRFSTECHRDYIPNGTLFPI